MYLHVREFSIPEKILNWAKDQEAHQRAHIGTHIDVYNCSKISIPSEIEVKVIDVRGVEIIDTDIIRGLKLKEGTFVIFRTGIMEKYGYGSESYFNSEIKPYLTSSLVDELLKNKVTLIGIDFHGIQHGKDHVNIDKYVENMGAYVIENICNLDKVSSEFMARIKYDQLEKATAIKTEIEAI
ncbi:MAG: cyclase family protein [Proteocatella sp.]